MQGKNRGKLREISDFSADELLEMAKQMSKETGKSVENCLQIVIDIIKAERASSKQFTARKDDPPKEI